MIELSVRQIWAPSLALSAGLRLRAFVGCCIAALVGMETYAAATGYGLRVTSDTPTFLPIVRDLGAHPFQPVSPFLNDSHVQSSHGSPYFQLLALLWRWVSPNHTVSGAPTADPRALYAFLSVVGLLVTLLVLHAVFVWARSQAGPRAAWLTIPVLLVLFGPAHVIWAGDLTFHGFLYAAYFPQNVALAFLCYALTALEWPTGSRRTVCVSLLVAATFAVHPFTGVLLAALIAARGCVQAIHRSSDWVTGSVAILTGFGIALLWPAYSMNGALVDSGLKGWVFVVLCASAPLVARGFERPAWMLSRGDRIAARLENQHRTWMLAALSVGSLLIIVALTVWEILLVHNGSSDPLIHSDRLAIYWVEDRWRWPLMFAGGAIGIVGLVWLARRRIVVPGIWFAGCFGLGLLGILGFNVPVWWRFLLFAQVPLALGTARILTRLRPGSLALGAATASLVALLVVKVGTLFFLPRQDTYFGSQLQETYDFSKIIPSAPGLVATDPFTAYYVPGSTGHRVLSVTKAHVNSNRELVDSERGYALLHQFFDGANWWQAARRMYEDGVRYVVVAKQTSLAAPTLAEFSTGPTPLVRTAKDRRLLGQYFYRNGRVGSILHDSADYVVYELERWKLWPR